MNELERLAQILQTYGGWSIVVVLSYALVRFYQDFKKTITAKDVLIQEMNQNHHQEMVTVVRECTGILTTVNESLEKCEKRRESMQ